MLLSATPRGARLARLLAVERLHTWGISSDAATHVVAELAANAATHGRVPGRSFRLTLSVAAGTLRVELTDTRRERLPKVQRPCAERESGRGLLVVEALADRWGVSWDKVPCKTVWAEITVPGD
ncbi:ATP-binding protein [Streptomyces misionensis]|uniref:ATP-binding protein n=1 Tax=Streptomyces misionensis TaxID=67331 RepID=A0A5C6K499_9ACTN|nr:ATP-binding protein [Streptomyces misionensis]TWV57166.1 ATP-binding protein [Streptomyces misionensis]